MLVKERVCNGVFIFYNRLSDFLNLKIKDYLDVFLRLKKNLMIYVEI